MDDSRRCTATSKQSGERCKRAAIVGGTVCKMHGGGSPLVKAAAEKRVAEEKLRKRLADYWTDAEGVSPSQAYDRALAVSTGNLQAMVQLMQDDDELSPAAVEFAQKLASDVSRVAMDGVKAGLEERRTAVAEAQAAELAGRLVSAAKAAGLSVEQTRALLEALRDS